MHLKTRNVNTAFRELVSIFNENKHRVPPCDPYPNVPLVKRPSRNGSVLMIDEPVTITYSHPRERVLFNQARDANPFFHMYEALWMLAGRNDVAPLAYYASRMKEFSDDGGTLNGAYGYRWRKSPVGGSKFGDVNSKLPHGEWWETVDQLDILVAHLKADPTSRRAVLQMWNVEDDLLKIGLHPERSGNFYNPDLKLPASKDVCCNLSVMFSLRQVGDLGDHGHYLDMTVTNRSNDMIWGMLGANYVHFTFLQEYMAARLGAQVGVYHHFTNNLHVYDWNWKPDEWLKEEELNAPGHHYLPYRYSDTPKLVPLVKDPAVFEKELPLVVTGFDGVDKPSSLRVTEPFFRDVAVPMFFAFKQYKMKDYEGGLGWAERIGADDWRIAATNWLTKRINKKETVNVSG